jgi:DNA replication and repair protein RecF
LLLTHLYLKKFRNYEDTHVHLVPGVNAFYGENGQGKSNFIEALHFLVTGQSFRTPRYKDLLMKGEPYAYIELDFQKEGVSQHLQVYFDLKEKRIYHNHTAYTQLRHLLGILQGVTLSPEDLMLTRGSPDLRRSVLNLYISQYDPLYVYHLLRYQKALKQRNALFRFRSLEGIVCWERELARSAAYLMSKRVEALQELEENMNLMKEQWLEQKHEVKLIYRHGFKSFQEEDITRELERSREKDRVMGYTRIGAQRDDFSFYLNGQEVRYFASEGQQRGCIVALRLAQWKRLKEREGEAPVLLIDDVRSSFDDLKIQRLLDFLPDLSQVVFTSTSDRWRSEKQKKFFVKSGEISDLLKTSSPG